ncbi:hypothetical protein [[Phormidium] sp. ETS-05]|uniref:hypothetical protein n=1 Tax=[Phormidium] sp. ETS-05 TaxID=222819 RepID=UPI0018EEE0BA|nr:hypothetical protein [[Phormidium] sp. ETS-05]
MKCVVCGTKNTLKERNANKGRCKRCQQPFAFDTSHMGKVPITDSLFEKFIAHISDSKTLYYTEEQLLYLINSRLGQKSKNIQKLGKFLLLAVGVALGVIIWVNSKQLFAGYAVVGIIGIRFFLVTSKQPKAQSFVVSRSQLQGWIRRWTELNRTMGKILPPLSLAQEEAPVREELRDYSFDRLVVCDRPEIAQMLIANNFHFENNCAVLSFNGYPQSIFTTVMEMLRRNPDLKVYALHDATPKGVSLVYELQTSPNWFLSSQVAIYDLGLLPRHIMKNSQIFLHKSPESAAEAKQLPAPVKQKYQPEEIAWLESGYYVELEVFSPRKLLQVVSQGIIKSQNMLPQDGSVGIIDGDGSAWTVTTGVGFLLADDNFG